VTLEDGRYLPADVVVIAAGAWSHALGESCGCALPLQPHRRHLALLQPEAGLPQGPVTWSVDLGVYFRRWERYVLACPADHTAHAAAQPVVDPTALELLRHKLRRVAPALADLPFAETWACLRTQTPDGEAVVGLDPRALGLYWFGGLAGFGMSASLAASQLLADLIADPTKLDGPSANLAKTLDPARWLHATARSEETIAK
jgi:sarcosine oxidase subunit beta